MSAREFTPRLGRRGGVLTPHVTTPAAAIATDEYFQHRWPPPQRLVRESSDHVVARAALRNHSVCTTDRVRGLGTRERGDQFESLSNRLKAEAIKSGECSQIGMAAVGQRGSVSKVEVL